MVPYYDIYMADFRVYSVYCMCKSKEKIQNAILARKSKDTISWDRDHRLHFESSLRTGLSRFVWIYCTEQLHSRAKSESLRLWEGARKCEGGPADLNLRV